MDGLALGGLALGLFLFATFIGGMTSGLAGFAVGLVVSGIWLRVLTPAQTVALIFGYGFVTQAYGTWQVRHAVTWRGVTLIVAGVVAGVPLGTVVLAHADPGYLRFGVGCLRLSIASTAWRGR